ncbi:hydroxyacid dehydrogenase [Tautonia plasticadhaerens]|uniref:D-3-phosphoglycerate dehydrogenase n=1 Tax=Tautonia plasticadhaerens TaxID=2527974 RepID=A0A518GVY2_9BACT|nr:hydroxyacid dehydrogenase [Tautonia plasticadhaerens]QDV32756.1 D-3-phosphoglycerate dehydrogenase [Tautonia plasticadhaerens]
MADRPRIFMMTTMHEDGMRLLHEAGEVVMTPSLDRAVLLEGVAGADAIVTRTYGTIDAELLDAAGPRLRVVGRHGVGVDHVDVPAATERGILVVSTPGANKEAVAEHVFAFMIGLSKHFPLQMASLREGRFMDRTKHMGRDIFEKTIGIVGFGNVGRVVGRIAHAAFSMRVLYNDIVPAPEDVENAAGALRVDFETALLEADYVTMHVPLDEGTRGMIDRRALSLMRPDAILINTCRGPVVDERAVAEALDAGKLWGYGADVFAEEPPPADHPLIGRPDVMLTPHSAAQTVESLRNMATWVAEDVSRVLRGDPPLRPYNDPETVSANRSRRPGVVG